MPAGQVLFPTGPRDRNRREHLEEGSQRRLGDGALGLVSRFTDLFRNPVSNRELVNDQYHLYFSRPLVAFNLLHLNRELTRIPDWFSAQDLIAAPWESPEKRFA